MSHEGCAHLELIYDCTAMLQGMYDVQVVARSTEGEELMCVVVHFEMLVSTCVPPHIPLTSAGFARHV